MRAILLAKATRTSIGGLQASMRAIQEPAGAPWRAAQRRTALAPIIGPVTAKVCVLAKALRNTQFVKSAAPDPQQNQALRPSFPRAPGGEVSRDPIDVRSTVRPQQRASC